MRPIPSPPGGPVSAVQAIADRAFAPDFVGPLANLATTAPPYEIVVHRRYNPLRVTAYNIVPGLLGVILTMTMVMITSIALTREAERGTLETLLATPLRPAEIMIGKTTPYIFVGAVQVTLVLLAARVLFGIPFAGSLLTFLAAVTLFIFTNLMLGYLISTAARSQMQAMQMTFMVFLPSILLVGLHVSVPRHAGLGAGYWRMSADHAFSAHRARRDAEGRGLGRQLEQHLAVDDHPRRAGQPRA